MWKTIRGTLIVLASALVLATGGCEMYTKTDYAPDAVLVMNTRRVPSADILCVALFGGA